MPSHALRLMCQANFERAVPSSLRVKIFCCLGWLFGACSSGSVCPATPRSGLKCGDAMCDAGCALGGDACAPPAGDVECGGAPCDAGCAPDTDVCGPPVADLPPVAKLRFGLRSPQSPDDYPFTPDAPPVDGAEPRLTVYLSAADSFDPEGQAISVYWNVQDPNGQYVTIDPDPSAARASFLPLFVGSYAITLEVFESGGLKQLVQTMFTMMVAPHPCAPDGFSTPCSDELAVPGGTFMAGSTDDIGFPNEHPRHLVNVAPFLMDKYEVTVGRFRRFLANFSGDGFPDGAGAHPLIPGSGWQSPWSGQTSQDFMISIRECGGAWTDDVGASEARPISCITWYQALAFCIAEGRRLPTEAEWEFAAAGGSEERVYPWGNDPPTVDRAVYGCKFDGQDGCSNDDLPVVGSVPGGAGRWGHLDLAGSVWEWILDVYAPYSDAICDNCANLNVTPEEGRVFRGGDFRFDDLAQQTDLRAASRLGFDAKFPDQTRGFRCARTP